MNRLKTACPRIKLAVTWVGFIILLAYCATSSLLVRPAWIAMYIALSLIVFPILYAFVVAPALKQFRKSKSGSVPTSNDEAIAASAAVYSYVQSNPLRLLLAIGEDGFFFLPLLYTGINPATAMFSSFAYAVMHYPTFPWWDCAMKWLFFYVVAIWILPHGILTVAIGHVLNDGLLFVLMPYLRRAEAWARK